MKVAVIALNQSGLKIAKNICRDLPRATLLLPGKFNSIGTGQKLKDLITMAFAEFDGLVMIMALGIVMRLISSLARDKRTDPAVVVVDEGGRFAISALSGHEGGANNLAVKVASAVGAEPVITTASEARKSLCLGIGCRRDISKTKVLGAINYALNEIKSEIHEVKWLATIDLKKKEVGLNQAAKDLELPIRYFNIEQINHFYNNIVSSTAAKKRLGVNGVCEPCAILGTRNGKLILPKVVIEGVTIAAASDLSEGM